PSFPTQLQVIPPIGAMNSASSPGSSTPTSTVTSPSFNNGTQTFQPNQLPFFQPQFPPSFPTQLPVIPPIGAMTQTSNPNNQGQANPNQANNGTIIPVNNGINSS